MRNIKPVFESPFEHPHTKVQALMFVTPLLQGSRYEPYSIRCSRILLGRTEGGVTNITACTFVGDFAPL
jgi:hypothetical protein